MLLLLLRCAVCYLKGHRRTTGDFAPRLLACMNKFFGQHRLRIRMGRKRAGQAAIGAWAYKRLGIRSYCCHEEEKAAYSCGVYLFLLAFVRFQQSSSYSITPASNTISSPRVKRSLPFWLAGVSFPLICVVTNMWESSLLCLGIQN